jgi:hypothetical protein
MTWLPAAFELKTRTRRVIAAQSCMRFQSRQGTVSRIQMLPGSPRLLTSARQTFGLELMCVSLFHGGSPPRLGYVFFALRLTPLWPFLRLLRWRAPLSFALRMHNLPMFLQIPIGLEGFVTYLAAFLPHVVCHLSP